MKAKKSAKKNILRVLRKHPEGLTLREITDLTKMSRLTLTKYVHELIGEDLIRIRKIGSAKLCYLKKSLK